MDGTSSNLRRARAVSVPWIPLVRRKHSPGCDRRGWESSFLDEVAGQLPGRRDCARASVTRRASLLATDPTAGQPSAVSWASLELSCSASWTCLLGACPFPLCLAKESSELFRYRCSAKPTPEGQDCNQKRDKSCPKMTESRQLEANKLHIWQEKTGE